MAQWRTTGRKAGGQAMVEYLVIATVVIAAILLARPAIQGAIQALFNNAAAKANDAANNLNNLSVNVP